MYLSTFSKWENIYFYLVLASLPRFPLQSRHRVQNSDCLQSLHQSIRAQATLQVNIPMTNHYLVIFWTTHFLYSWLYKKVSCCHQFIICDVQASQKRVYWHDYWQELRRRLVSLLPTWAKHRLCYFQGRKY